MGLKYAAEEKKIHRVQTVKGKKNSRASFKLLYSHRNSFSQTENTERRRFSAGFQPNDFLRDFTVTVNSDAGINHDMPRAFPNSASL